MQIEITSSQYEKLNAKALAAGYADVSAMIHAIAEEPTADPRGSLNEKELRESVARCEKANAQIEADGGRDAREAMLKIGKELGFELPE